MTTLDADFDRKLKQSLLDEAEREAERIGQQLKDVAEENFKDYASENDYDVSHIWEDAAEPVVERSGDTVTVRVEWPELTALFEFGVSPHTIEGAPLAFAWPAPPEGTRPPGAPAYVETESVNWGSVTGGIDEARAIRSALDLIRLNLSGEVSR
jgi:hypothetical protein